MKIETVRLIKTRVLKIQQMGRLLSSIIMPNIGAFITWGLLAALFLPQGWWPNASLASIVSTMGIYLLPTLIAYTGGKVVYGHRGGVLGAIMAMGMTAGSSIPMFFGAMLVGPLAALVIKKFDQLIENKIPSGFEMLVNNFSTGILGCLLAVGAFVGISPLMVFLVQHLGALVDNVIVAGALPLAAFLIEPAKILFLNNAINHGVLNPLGMEQAVQTGSSILFLLETNPGPGLGVLLAYWVYAKGAIRKSAPSAIIIHALGGIHEIYFPYVLMQPKLVLALIAGSVSGVFVFSTLGAGLLAMPSPGSIVALVAMTPKGGILAVLAGVFVSTLVSFLLSFVLIDRRLHGESDDSSDTNDKDAGYAAIEAELREAKGTLAQLKESNPLIGHDNIPEGLLSLVGIKTIAVACDAGMGSSVMGAGRLRTKLDKAGVKVNVISCPIDQLDSTVNLVITHESLSHRAYIKLPQAAHISITDFINTDIYQQLLSRFVIEAAAPLSQAGEKNTSNNPPEPQILIKENIKLGLKTMSKEEAIALAGTLLREGGYVELAYVDAMQTREQDCSTYMANGVAIPHGTSEAREMIKHSGMCILQFPEGVDFDGNIAHLVVGIAAVDSKHLALLSKLASIIESEELMQIMRSTSDTDDVYRRFTH